MQRKHSSLSILTALILLFIFACGKEETPVLHESFLDSYPQSFIFEGLELGASNLYLVNGNAYDPIEGLAITSQIDSFIEGLLENPPTYFSEFQFLSDSIVKVKIKTEGVEEELEGETNYAIEEDQIKIFHMPQSSGFYLLSFDEENQLLTSCIQTFTFVHENRSFQPLRSAECISANENEIIDDLIDNEITMGTLQVNDTLVLNLSNYIYKL